MVAPPAGAAPPPRSQTHHVSSADASGAEDPAARASAAAQPAPRRSRRVAAAASGRTSSSASNTDDTAATEPVEVAERARDPEVANPPAEAPAAPPAPAAAAAPANPAPAQPQPARRVQRRSVVGPRTARLNQRLQTALAELRNRACHTVVDIDDMGKQIRYVTDYVEDIYGHMREQEAVRRAALNIAGRLAPERSPLSLRRAWTRPPPRT